VRRVGLTGGIATGKSTVAQILKRQHGCAVIDADAVSRTLVTPGSPALIEIQAEFGNGVILPNGTLDRARLRAAITADSGKRNALNAILHPRIQESTSLFLRTAERSGADIAFVEAALLVEVGSYKKYDSLWVVTCEEDVQISRLMSRDTCTRSTAIAMIATQMPQAEKCAVADFIIRNNNDHAHLVDCVATALADERKTSSE
jgi:dephospho-CoA kinase